MKTRHIKLIGALAWLCVGPIAGCGDGGDREDVAPGAGDAGSDAGDDGGADGGADGGSAGCTEEGKLVYVVDHDRSLYSFYPPDKDFEHVGIIDCVSAGDPFSMAVSRDDVAYVLYWGGVGGSCMGINAVSILDAHCIETTPFQCGQSGFYTFGMGYATDGADTSDETLYVGKTDFEDAGGMLASLDTSAWTVEPIGPIADAPEMTGNANGELWAFYAWATPPRVVRLDKISGEEVASYVLDISSEGSAFAFAHWGGEFYLFHAPGGADTTVYKLSIDGDEHELVTWMTGTGLTIVGAGVSTCAPVIPE